MNIYTLILTDDGDYESPDIQEFGGVYATPEAAIESGPALLATWTNERTYALWVVYETPVSLAPRTGEAITPRLTAEYGDPWQGQIALRCRWVAKGDCSRITEENPQ